MVVIRSAGEDGGCEATAAGGARPSLIEGSTGTGDGTVAGETIMSRMSPGHVFRVVREFSKFKKDLVNAIGFGGLLEIPNLQKLNLRLSKWLLSRVDIETRSILLDERTMLRFYDEDVEKIFGIPCGPRKLYGEDVAVTPEGVAFMSQALGLVQSNSHSLRQIEAVLTREVTENSSRLEQECFQMAFVIFVMGHLFAPSAKHDYVSIDYWGALKSADHIMHYNWCSYVVVSLLDAARKVQSDTKGPVNLFGCHLFLQVFLLDNMDLNRYNLRHNVFPRIKEFGSERMKQMIQRCFGGGSSEDIYLLSMPRTADSVCYVRSNKEHAWSRGEKYENTSQGGGQRLANSTSQSGWHRPANSAPPQMRNAGRRETSMTPQSEEPNVKFGQEDYDKYLNASGIMDYLRDKHPSLNTSKVMDYFKRHNAMCVKHVTDSQKALQKNLIRENIRLLDKLICAVGSDCLQVMTNNEQGGDVKSPVGSTGSGGPVMGQKCNMLASDEGYGESSAASSSKGSIEGRSRENLTKRRSNASGENDEQRTKRPAIEGHDLSSRMKEILKDRSDIPSFDLHIEDMFSIRLVDNQGHSNQGGSGECSPRTRNKAFSEGIIGEIIELENERKNNLGGKVLFGDLTPSPPPRKKLVTGQMSPNPFLHGRVHPKPPYEVAISMYKWVTGHYATDLDKAWVTHLYPRHVQLTGRDMKEQLFGDTTLEPDMCSMIMRRFGQLDKDLGVSSHDLRWRHFMEPDFATFALSGEDVHQVLSIQNQFIGENVTYSLARTQMIVVPARLSSGWVCYVWDMLKKQINVLDPANPQALDNDRRCMHEDVTKELHSALVKCISHYFDDWVISEFPWDRIYPTLGNERYNEKQSGLAMVYYARNFNGKKLEYPLDKESFMASSQRLLYDLVNLEGNMSKIPQTAVDVMTMDANV